MSTFKIPRGPYIDDIEFDSLQELYFYLWVKDLRANGYVDDLEIQPEFKLFPGLALGEFGDMRPHNYHADFTVKWNQKARGVFCGPGTPLIARNNISHIEIKPIIRDGKRGRKQDPQKREYITKINIKWAYQICGVLVQVVYCDDLFKKTFAPLAYAAKSRDRLRLFMDFAGGRGTTRGVIRESS